ncbi:hypothetical protein D3C80_1863020 [compost metagenome]
MTNRSNEIQENLKPYIKDAEIKHMSRIVYYGLGRVNDKDSEIFQTTREILKLLLSLNFIQKLDTRTMVFLSQNQIQTIENNISATLENETNRKR